MLCFVVGGLLLPIVGAVDIQTAKIFFGLGALLFKGRPSRSMMSGFGANDLCPRNKTTGCSKIVGQMACQQGRSEAPAQ